MRAPRSDKGKDRGNSAVRFWSKVNVGSRNDCWHWMACKDQRGYGTFYFQGKRLKAHRVAWMLHHKQEFPSELHGCHQCDNPSCVNPLHIWPGTRSENMKDARLKGRLPLPSEVGSPSHNKLKTQCKRGHQFDVENTFVFKDGRRACRKCQAASRTKYELKLKRAALKEPST